MRSQVKRYAAIGTLPTAGFLTALILVVLDLPSQTILVKGAQAQKARGNSAPAIPKTWDDAAMATLEVPLANPIGSPKHVSADYYYRIPVRPTYKSYPVYAPGHEPPGYMDWLKQQEPQIVWDDAGHAPALKTEADWIKAGEIVFESPVGIDFPVAVEASAARLSAQQKLNDLTTVTEVREPAWYQKVGTPISKDGTMPFGRYFIRKKGTVEFGTFSCATCHTRVMPDGSVLKGAQGNSRLIAVRLTIIGPALPARKTPRRLSATCAPTSASSTQCLG